MTCQRSTGFLIIGLAAIWLLFAVLPLAVRACDGTAPEAPQGVTVGP